MHARYPRLTLRPLAALTLAAGLAAVVPPAAAQPPAPAVRPGQPVTLNFQEAEIESVARAIALASGRHIVVDPRVKGTMTLVTENPVGPQAALSQFGAELRLRGFALVESQGIYKIVPEAEAKLLGGPVLTEEQTPRDGQLVTQIFRLQHENANTLLPVLRPLISPNNPITVNPGNNALVITDYADNLRRLARIIAALDTVGGTDLEILPLRHAVASDIVPLLQQLLDGEASVVARPVNAGTAPAPAAVGGPRTTVLAEPRSNAILVRAANPARLALVRALVEKLDRPTAGSAAANVRVVYLRNADAVRLAATLRAALAADAGPAAGPTTAAGAGSPPARLGTSTPATNTAATPPTGAASAGGDAISTGGIVQADPASNALIITAPEPLYRQLRQVIDQLDVRRAQVYVESLIAEVNADKVSEIGIQWQGVLGQQGSGTLGVIGTNSSVAGANILGVTAGLAAGGTQAAQALGSLGGGLNVALAPRFNGRYYLGALAHFLQSTGNANILSTPNLLTLDNEEAKIVIGQNVPFVTGQYTANNTNQGAVNPFQTIERKDVGLTLRVKPQINEQGTVKLQIFQEVSSVLPSSINSPTGLITNKRSIESTVLVEDGGIVVLGGLLQDEFGGNEDKVPGLGDVPVLGQLFRSEKRSRKKTNLMVFLRPVVVRDARQTDALAVDRYEWMRAVQRDAQPAPSSVHPVNTAPVLPPLSSPAGGTGSAPSPATPTPNAPAEIPAHIAPPPTTVPGASPASPAGPNTDQPATTTR
ncbi:type II secretion system secretin GspD [Tepidimonas taiwanensis]|uniref:Type II secretion system protein D n=2 Tax=Tepidimonas taiwanensis TaxID=307486 RepID=A0A554X3D6_9BURK|nr:type II secretion system secretin GspD [Tepidimonas taiwanensis]TSE30286.1 Type II secretion system protein D [Tepidimonas taiwanensis]UBQ04780.1 type II secretion system secretin GspD [Tepidimonas taiwanensis]